jgi:hypothetical protein
LSRPDSCQGRMSGFDEERNQKLEVGSQKVTECEASFSFPFRKEKSSLDFSGMRK